MRTSDLHPSSLTSEIGGCHIAASIEELIERLASIGELKHGIESVLESCVNSTGCDSAFWFSTSTKTTSCAIGQVSKANCSQFACRLLDVLPAMETCRWVNPDSRNREIPAAALVARSRRTTGCIILTSFAPAKRFSEQDEEFARLALSMLLGFRSHARSATKKLLTGLVHSLAAVIDAKDPYTAGHSERVARIAVVISNSMGLSKEVIGDLFLAGLLHDIGKIGVRDSVLLKPGKLTPDEFEEIKLHPVIGERIVRAVEPLKRLSTGIRHHHERFDGTGYPDGICGEKLPLLARVLALADALDAMMSPRRYRPCLSPIEIDAILGKEKGKQFDPDVVSAFMRVRDQVYPPIYQKGIGDSAYHAVDCIVDASSDTGGYATLQMVNFCLDPVATPYGLDPTPTA